MGLRPSAGETGVSSRPPGLFVNVCVHGQVFSDPDVEGRGPAAHCRQPADTLLEPQLVRLTTSPAWTLPFPPASPRPGAQSRSQVSFLL